MPYYIEKKTMPITTQTFHSLSDIPHLHTHLEMVYLVKGSSIASADYREFPVGEGDIFLAFPNQIHFYYDQEPVSGHLIIFSNDLFKELKETFQTKVPVSPVVKKEQLPPDVRETLDKIMVKNTTGARFDEITARGYLLAFLGELLSAMTLVPSSSHNDNIKNILTYCSEKYTEPLSLDILARDLHMNKYYISHIFKERLNTTFPDFVNSLRVEYACGILEKGESITDIAFASGFSSIRTFNRAFYKKMGMTPREYMKRNL